ncbi:precorrin-6y C5,15-methyltransferase (decarboxylating) subunit CbiE [Thermocatellispora tengchongensis]
MIGFDGSELPAVARARLDAAALVAGPERIVRRVRPPEGAKVAAIPADGPWAAGSERGELLDAVDQHLEHGEGPVVVVAEGDPGFFGSVRDLRGHGLAPEVIPGTSLVSRAFARAGLPWEDALVVCTRELRRAANVCRAHPKVAVFVTPEVGPAEIARELAPTTPRSLIVFEDLGGPDERVTHSRMGEATTRPWKDPDLVLVLDPHHRSPDGGWLAGARPGPGAWAVTPGPGAGAAEEPALAFVLAKLGPRLGDLVWDVGAGEGAVAVECARFGAAVVAVERDKARCEAIRRNVIARGVKVALARGQAPPALEPLPDPDSVYVGGGGPDVVAACAARGPATLVCELRAVERVPAVLAIMREHGYRAEGVQIQAARLGAGPDGTHHLAAADPVFVVHGTRR